MKFIQLKHEVLIGGRTLGPGAVVEVDNTRAKLLVERGHADYCLAPGAPTDAEALGGGAARNGHARGVEKAVKR